MPASAITMTLGKKIALFLAVLGCCIAAGCFLAIRTSILPAFENFEKDSSLAALGRLERVLEAERRNFSTVNREYSSWDDTYNFALDHDLGYVERSLDGTSWNNNGVDLILILDTAGKRIFGRFTNRFFGDISNLDEMLETPISAQHRLFNHGSIPHGTTGLVRTSYGPLLLAADPILTSYDEGPSAGTFIIGRFVDQRLVSDLASRSSTDLTTYPVTASGAHRYRLEDLRDMAAADGLSYVERTETEVITHELLRDMDGEPAILLEVRAPRIITAIGNKTIYAAVGLIAALTALFLLVALFFLRRVIVAPINTLSERIQHIQKTGELNVRLGVVRTDEIGSLARNFEEMTTDLYLAQKELEATRDVAVDASRAKSEFLARMSHEIRTPMNGVLGMTELLKNTPLGFEQRRFANTIYSSAENLLEIINDVLDFSKIEAGKMRLESQDIDLGAVIEETVDSLASQAHQKGLELINDVSPGVHTSLKGDAVRLRQVLTNLIANAIKFTNRGEVVARASITADDGDHVTVRVEITDTGVGIKPEKQKLIFESFAQEDGSTTRVYGGTGLGLAISKQLVDLMGGQLQVSSTPGIGSKFSFNLRMQRGDKPVTPACVHGGRVAGTRVLVVDDNATNRDILEQQLAGWRAHCDTADSAEEAEKCLRAALAEDSLYDLVILDMHMPHVDGLGLAHRIRGNEAYDSVRLMLLSSVSVPASEAALQDLRIAGQLTKPIRQAQLYDSLAVVLSGEALSEQHGLSRVGGSRRLSGRVLLAEDNPVNQAVALGMLDSMGIDVAVVTDGQAAVRATETQAFDVILMDCQMPVMDGLAATKQIRQREADRGSRRLPIVALTANAMAGDRERCVEVGMDDYLGKPFTMDQLHAVLSIYLGVAEDDSLAADGAQDAALDAAAADRTGEADRSLDRSVLAVLTELQQPGGNSLVQRVIGIYLDSSPELKERLITAIASNDSSAIRESAHALKSSSNNVGAVKLAGICKRLETMARTNELESVTTAGHDLEEEYPRVVEALRTELQAVSQ